MSLIGKYGDGNLPATKKKTILVLTKHLMALYIHTSDYRKSLINQEGSVFNVNRGERQKTRGGFDTHSKGNLATSVIVGLWAV